MVVRIEEVKTRKQRKDFLKFPLKLYKNCPYFVPALYMDEKKIFDKDYVYNDICDVVFYNAYKEDKIVGRISGIIQLSSNEKWSQKRIRFTRFDCIDDQEVANALFDAVIGYAKEHNLEEIVGPLGYSDLEREGLLIEGFDELGTYEEQYNYPYYQKLIENYGFDKEIDWVERKLYLPDEPSDKLKRIGDLMLKRYELTKWQPTSIRKFIKNNIDDFFEIIDITYDKIYGTVPFTDKMKKMMISNFKLLVKPKDIMCISDKEGRLVGFAIMFSSISDAVRKSRGYLTLPFIFRFLKSKYRPKVMDFGLIGVLPQYESKGVAGALWSDLFDFMKERKIDHFETNLMLENNYHIQNLSANFKYIQNKRRRCFIKKIN